MNGIRDAVLIVMARYPVAGATKTRLAAAIGEAAAVRLYRAFLTDLDQRLADLAVPVHWHYTPPERDFAALLRHPARCYAQASGDLGQRMHEAFRAEFLRGARRVVMIGSDAPHLDLAVVRAAFERCSADRVVLGPADDGGYYLIGLADAHTIFDGVRWSSATVLTQTRSRAAELGLAVDLLPGTFDVDEAADLTTLEQFLAHQPPAFLPATRAALDSIPTARPG